MLLGQPRARGGSRGALRHLGRSEVTDQCAEASCDSLELRVGKGETDLLPVPRSYNLVQAILDLRARFLDSFTISDPFIDLGDQILNRRTPFLIPYKSCEQPLHPIATAGPQVGFRRIRPSRSAAQTTPVTPRRASSRRRRTRRVRSGRHRLHAGQG
jgi:hypothetical protein